jgi:hypothetical protein
MDDQRLTLNGNDFINLYNIILFLCIIQTAFYIHPLKYIPALYKK